MRPRFLLLIFQLMSQRSMLQRSMRPVFVLGCAAVLASLLLTARVSHAADAEAAAIRWSLYDDSSRNFDQAQEVIDYGCERLRRTPPSVPNAEVRVLQCGAQSGSEASSRQIKIHYTLQVKNFSLDQVTTSKNTFTVLRKPYCPSTQFPYLQEENNAAFRYSCWRCPLSDVSARAPRFISSDKVRWYRNNLCPLDFDLSKPAELQTSFGLNLPKPQTLPKAFGFADNDAATLYMLRESAYGRVALLQLPSGQPLLFLGDESTDELTPDNSKNGVLQRDGNDWRWLSGDRTEYRFAMQSDSTFKISHKKVADGRRWQFFWQNISTASNDWRMESVLDPLKQRYQFQYSKQGRLIGLAVHSGKTVPSLARQ